MIKITFLGDILCDNDIAGTMDKYLSESSAKYEFSGVFRNIEPLLKKSDYVIANLETPIARYNKELTYKKWEFNTPHEFAEALKSNGINLVTTANNHCLDRGIDGLISTLETLDSIGLEHCGTQMPGGDSYCIIKVGKIKIGILSYTYGTNAFSNKYYLPFKYRKSVNMLQEQEEFVKRIWQRLFEGRFWRVYNKLENLFFPNNQKIPVYEKNTISQYRKYLIKKDISHLKRNRPDIIVSCLHIGGQYNELPTLYTKKMTDWFMKKGCDIVVGNHEHVVHGIKKYRESIVAYSLGNCVGSAGVIGEPFGKDSEYSIAFHVYVDEVKSELVRYSFSVLKTILNQEGKIEVWPACSLMDKLKQEERILLREGILKIAEKFAGTTFDKVEMEFPVL